MKKILIIFLLVSGIWIALTNIIYAIKNPKVTYTELFLHLPKTILLKWE
jgi:hypothetical protein